MGTTKTMKIEHEVFNFWKENKLDGHFTLDRYELEKSFRDWLGRQDRVQLRDYSTQFVVTWFISDRSGLNSTPNNENDRAEIKSMEMLLKDVLNAYLKGDE